MRTRKIPVVWIGFILWFVLLFGFLLGLNIIVLYIILGLLLVDKALLMANYYSAIARIKMLQYTLEAYEQTQILLSETQRSGPSIKMDQDEG